MAKFRKSEKFLQVFGNSCICFNDFESERVDEGLG